MKNACDTLIAEIKAEQNAVGAVGAFDWKSTLMQILLILLDAWKNKDNPTP